MNDYMLSEKLKKFDEWNIVCAEFMTTLLGPCFIRNLIGNLYRTPIPGF
jgi:hypothetical protein